MEAAASNAARPTAVPPGAVPSLPPAVSLIAHRGKKKLYRVGSTTMDVDERYDILSVIGRGSYGVVCSVKDEVSGQNYAIKKVEHLFSDLIDGRRMYREICVLRLLTEAKARNTIQLVSLLQPTEELSRFQDLYIVSDLFYGDLGGLSTASLTNIGGLRLQRARGTATLHDGVRSVACDILTAIADMHALGIIHRDIKPQNVLVGGARQSVMYLCDFGLARGGVERVTLPANFTDHVVTRWYRGPELLTMSPYGYAVDVFSAGCVIAELILRKALFQGRDYLDQLRLIVTGLFPDGLVGTAADWIPQDVARRFVESCAKPRLGAAVQLNASVLSVEDRLAAAGTPKGLIDLILSLIAFDPAARPSAATALKDPLLRELIVPHPDASLLVPREDHDWSLDAPVTVSEARLRRLIWNEISHYHGGS